MEPITLAALIGAAGAVGTTGLSAYAQNKINQQNILANQHRFAAETELANTAHQREVVDLRLAGLNPILSAGGSGASVPTQAAYEGKAPDLSALATLGDAVNNARATSSQLAVNDANIAAKQGDIAEQKALKDFYESPQGKLVARARAAKLATPETPTQAAIMGLIEGSRHVPTPTPSANTAQETYKQTSLNRDDFDDAHSNKPSKDMNLHQENYERWMRDMEDNERLKDDNPWMKSFLHNKKHNKRRRYYA